MCVDCAHRRVEARIRDAGDTDTPVVARNILHKPINSVIRIRRFVDIIVAFLDGLVRTEVNKCPLRHVPSADVLIGEDVAVARLIHRRNHPVARRAGAVGSHAVRGAIENDRVLLGGVLRRVDRRKEPDPITHRDIEFVLVVVLFDVQRVLCVEGKEGNGYCDNQE